MPSFVNRYRSKEHLAGKGLGFRPTGKSPGAKRRRDGRCNSTTGSGFGGVAVTQTTCSSSPIPLLLSSCTAPFSSSKDNSCSKATEKKRPGSLPSEIPHIFYSVQPLFIEQQLQAKDRSRHRRSGGVGGLIVGSVKGSSLCPPCVFSVRREIVPGDSASPGQRTRKAPQPIGSGVGTGQSPQRNQSEETMVPTSLQSP